MKIFLKFAGITTVTLLTISPVITPVFSTVTEVKADVTVPNSKEVEEFSQNIKDSLEGQIVSYDFNREPESQLAVLENGFQNALDKNINDGSILLTLGSSMRAAYWTPFVPRTLQDWSKTFSDFYMTLKIYDPNGNQIKTKEDLDAAIKSDPRLDGYTENVGLAYATDASGDKYTEIDVTKGLDIIDFNDISSANVDLQVPDVTVEQGSLVSNVDTSKIKMVIKDNNGVQFGKAVGAFVRDSGDPDGGYFKDLKAARLGLDPFSSNDDKSNKPNTSGTFTDVGTYYIAVDLTTSKAANQYIENYLTDTPSDKVKELTINGEKAQKTSYAQDNLNYYIDGEMGNSVVQKVIVTPKSSSNTNSHTNTHTTQTNTNAHKNTNNTNANNSIYGVATTHSDKTIYSLFNDDNKKETDRALVKESSWKVDKVRTIEGVKQYRVATHEWVNASDVDFVEGGKITNKLTVRNLDKIKEIHVDASHNIYDLYNSKQEISKVRALSGNTDWLVSKIGTDTNGHIYYGVSTDEFVKAGDGVTVIK